MNLMKKLALFFLAMASFSVTEANAQTIFRISPGANCPDFTEKYIPKNNNAGKPKNNQTLSKA